MKRFRLSTLMLLVVIAALSCAVVMQMHRLARREAELEIRRAEMEQMKANIKLRVKLELALEKASGKLLKAEKGTVR